MKESIEGLPVKKEIDTLEKAVASNTAEISSLQVMMNQFVNNQQMMKPVNNEALDKFLNDSQTVFSNLEEITSIQMKHSEDNLDGKAIVAKLAEINEANNVIKHELGELNKKENEAKQAATEISVPILKSIEENIAKLVANLNASSKAQESVRPKEQPRPEYAAQDSTERTAVDCPGDEDIVELNKRRGLFFSSSIGLGCDMRVLQDRLDSEITAIPTYHIEKRQEVRDPELNLKNNLKVELDKNEKVDFIIVGVGTNDITKLNTENEDITKLTTKAWDQAKDIVHLANEASQKYNVEVFVVEKPPRDDGAEKDPNGFLNLCNVSSNGLYPSLIKPLDKVHFIPLPSLHTLPDSSMKNLFKDGVHLKNWGTRLLTQDMIRGVKSVFKDIKEQDENFQKDGRKENFSNPNHTRRMFQQGGGNNRDNNVRTNNRSPEMGRKQFGDFGYNEQTQEIYKLEENFHPHEKKRNSQYNQPTGDRRERDLDGNQPSGRRNFGNEQSQRGQGSFHPRGRNGNNGRRGNGQQDFQPRRSDDGQNFQRDGNTRYNEQGQRNDNRDRGQHKEDEMPELIKEYLRKTLRDGRY